MILEDVFEGFSMTFQGCPKDICFMFFEDFCKQTCLFQGFS